MLIAVLLFLLAAPCDSPPLDCRNAKELRFEVVENLQILVGDKVISRIELPKESEVKNFSLNSVEKTKAGFEIRVDWGGDLYHYEIQFNFRCTENGFYLDRVNQVSFSTTNPLSGNFWDKRVSKTIKRNLPLRKFVITDYL